MDGGEALPIRHLPYPSVSWKNSRHVTGSDRYDRRSHFCPGDTRRDALILCSSLLSSDPVPFVPRCFPRSRRPVAGARLPGTSSNRSRCCVVTKIRWALHAGANPGHRQRLVGRHGALMSSGPGCTGGRRRLWTAPGDARPQSSTPPRAGPTRRPGSSENGRFRRLPSGPRQRSFRPRHRWRGLCITRESWMIDRMSAAAPRSEGRYAHWTWRARPAQLAAIRVELRRWLASLEMTENTRESMVLAVGEAAANSIGARLSGADRGRHRRRELPDRIGGDVLRDRRPRSVAAATERTPRPGSRDPRHASARGVCSHPPRPRRDQGAASLPDSGGVLGPGRQPGTGDQRELWMRYRSSWTGPPRVGCHLLAALSRRCSRRP